MRFRQSSTLLRSKRLTKTPSHEFDYLLSSFFLCICVFFLLTRIFFARWSSCRKDSLWASDNWHRSVFFNLRISDNIFMFFIPIIYLFDVWQIHKFNTLYEFSRFALKQIKVKPVIISDVRCTIILPHRTQNWGEQGVACSYNLDFIG